MRIELFIFRWLNAAWLTGWSSVCLNAFLLELLHSTLHTRSHISPSTTLRTPIDSNESRLQNRVIHLTDSRLGLINQWKREDPKQSGSLYYGVHTMDSLVLLRFALIYFLICSWFFGRLSNQTLWSVNGFRSIQLTVFSCFHSELFKIRKPSLQNTVLKTAPELEIETNLDTLIWNFNAVWSPALGRSWKFWFFQTESADAVQTLNDFRASQSKAFISASLIRLWSDGICCRCFLP